MLRKLAYWRVLSQAHAALALSGSIQQTDGASIKAAYLHST
jgi:hypothetical protein